MNILYLSTSSQVSIYSNSDSDSLDDDAEETALESYQTPLDDENSPIDEYIIFKHIFSSKYF